GGISRAESAGDDPDARRRRHRALAVARDHRVPRLALPGAAPDSGGARGASARASARAADRVRDPPAEQPARAEIPAWRAEARRSRGVEVVLALDRGSLRPARNARHEVRRRPLLL